MNKHMNVVRSSISHDNLLYPDFLHLLRLSFGRGCEQFSSGRETRESCSYGALGFAGLTYCQYTFMCTHIHMERKSNQRKQNREQ